MNRVSRTLRVFAVAGLSALTFLTLAGCGGGDKVKLVPVSGKVLLGSESLTAGTVTFEPDESKGNTTKRTASGIIDANGNYKLATGTDEGAAPGWYKVGVNPTGMSAGGMGPSEVPSTPGDPMKALAKSKSSVNVKYQTAGSSGISVEVSENPAPGAYDLKVTK